MLIDFKIFVLFLNSLLESVLKECISMLPFLALLLGVRAVVEIVVLVGIADLLRKVSATREGIVLSLCAIMVMYF